MSSFTSEPQPGADAPAPDESETACGPGWYESSWDLRCGLVVVERQVDGPAAIRLRACPHDWLLRHGRGSSGEPGPDP